MRCKICGVEDRGAKNLCHKHYAAYSRGGYCPKCKVPGCEKTVQKINKHGYCTKHWVRKSKNLSLDLNKDLRKRYGKENHNWNGGTSEYPNHCEMKRARIKKLKLTHGKCEICGKLGKQVHHIDGKKTNHKISNLLVVCYRCHLAVMHGGRKNTSKFIRKYGMTLTQMVERYGNSVGYYFSLHEKNGLRKFLQNNKM